MNSRASPAARNDATAPSQAGPTAQAKTRPVVRAERLRKSFGGQVVLGGIDLELREGEVVLLRGDNGSGKTTLLNLLTGNLEPDGGNIWLNANGTEENFRFPRHWWENLNPFDHFTPERVAREAVGRTWQDVRLFETQTLRDNIAVATPRQRGENPAHALVAGPGIRRDEEAGFDRARDILARLGLAGREQSSADQISLGQTKRVAIARAVAAGAKVLLLDEPLAGLDAAGIESVMGMLGELVRSHRITLVIIEHAFNIPRVLELADTVLTLSNGKLTLASASVVRAQISTSDNGSLRGWVRKHLNGSAEEIVEEWPAGARLIRFCRHDSRQRVGEAVLELENVVVFRGRRRVIGWEQPDGSLSDLNLRLDAGETAILEAPNGWGKTTLVEAIGGLLPISSGEVRYRQTCLRHQRPWDRARRDISILLSRDHQFDNLTVAESLSLSPCETHTASPFPEAFSSRLLSSLSGGERQKVALACLPRVGLKIYDEPFSALDENSFENVCPLIIAPPSGATLILIPRPAVD